METAIGFVIIGGVAFIVGILLMRAILGTGKIIKQGDAIITLLKKIVENMHEQ